MGYDELVAMLARWDDDAWAALANRGLLRRARKDLDALAVALVSRDPVVVSVGEHEVAFGGSTLADARCSCPATTICQHLLTAGLWLAAGAAAAPPTELHDELMALDVAALAAYSGRAALRWAAQYVADLEQAGVRIEQGRQVLIGLASPRVTFRYMGGGLPGLVPDAKLPSPEKYAVAAVLAYQRAHGAGPVDVEPVRRRETATTRAQAEGRERFLRAAGELLLDTVRLGASHLSPAVHQRYETMAVWAQGAELHRLALMLRRLADQVELLLDRSARADEHALLDEAAIAFALTSALRAAGEPAPVRLAGRARTTYSPVRSMELVGLGGTPWHAASGYHGLTCLFWWVEERRFVSWTDARPDTMWGFDPRARWTQAGPWTGLHSPSLTAGRSVHLSDAQLSPTGRLSGVERTRASVGPLLEPPWDAMPVVSRWSDLDDRVRGRVSLLDQPDPLAEWVLLRPAAADPAVFDPIRQAVWWVIRDDAGAALPLMVRWTPLAAHAVQRLESLTPAEVHEDVLVVARIGSRSGRLVGEPLSIVRGHRVVDVLHFDDGAAPSAPVRSLAIRADEGEDEPSVPLPAALVEHRAWLLRQLERGTGAVAPSTLLAGLEQRHRAARDLGFSVFPRIGAGSAADAAAGSAAGSAADAAAAEPLDPAEALLRSHYLGLQVADLLA